jgi:hypothetical protein
MPILKILPDAVDTTQSYVFGNVSASSITANGTNLGTAVAEAFVLANNANKSTTSDTAPSNPKVGDTWFDTVTNVLLRYTNDGVSNNWIDISGPQNSGYIYQTYSITPNTSTINETTGNTVIYTVATTNIADNTVLYWTNSGTTVASDFSDSVSNGSVTIINNSATFTRSLVADLTTETTETIALSLRTGSNTGPIVAVATTVTVGDTSITPAFYSVQYLVVAGGGASGQYGGGGGAGGYLTGTMNLTTLNLYPITIGAGGTSAVAYSGGNTVFQGANTVTAFGGGAGSSSNGGAYDGGSGGGGYSRGGTGVVGQGNNGSGGTYSQGFVAGGAGGAGAAGGYPPGGNAGFPGVAGVGLQWLNGTYYAGGGGTQGAYGYQTGTGGLGGGGTGSNGSPNTGGGGGSGNNSNNYSGGSGIVIIRYLTGATDSGGNPINPSGGTSSTSGSYTYHTFTTSGTLTA